MSPNNILVSVVNGTGAVIEAVYVLIFLIFAPKKEKMKIFGILMVILTIFGTVAFVSMFALHHNKRKVFCGFAAAIFSVIMYGSPLSVMVRTLDFGLVFLLYVRRKILFDLDHRIMTWVFCKP